jgi:hypothetical protein
MVYTINIIIVLAFVGAGVSLVALVYGIIEGQKAKASTETNARIDELRSETASANVVTIIDGDSHQTTNSSSAQLHVV